MRLRAESWLIDRVKQVLETLKKTIANLSEPQTRSQERYRSIALSAIAATVAKLVSAAMGILSAPIVVHHLGKEQFGLWMVVSSLVIWLQLAEFGIANGLSNALAEAHGRNDSQAASGYLSSAIAATVVVAILCLPLLAIAYYGLNWVRILNLANPELARKASDALLVAGLAFIVNIPLSLAARAFLAYQRSYVSSYLQVGASVATVAGLWIAVELDLGLTWFVGIAAFVPMTANLFLWFGLSKLDARLTLGIDQVKRSALSRVAASSVPLFLFQVGALLLNQLVNLVIARTATLSLVADYNVVLRIYIFVFAIAAGLSNPFYAAIREASEKGDTRWASKAVQHSLAVRLLATFPFAATLLIAGDVLLKWWIGQSIAPPIGHWGWACVGLSLFLSATSSLLSEVLSCLDDIWAQVGVVFLSAATVLGLLYILIPVLGVPGVFVAMAVSTIFPLGWSYRRLKRRFAHA